KNYSLILFLALKLQGGIQNPMVGLRFVENLVRINCTVHVHQHSEVAFPLPVDGIPIVQQLILRKLVDQTNELACLKIFGIVSFFEIIQLLQDRDRNANIMFVKVEDGVVFVDNNGG